MATSQETGFRSRYDIIENERELLEAIETITNARQKRLPLDNAIAHAAALTLRIRADRPNFTRTSDRTCSCGNTRGVLCCKCDGSAG